ncbi:putative ribonuclease H-like domain-containing protein [Tanacetum coccineum]
MVLNSPCFTVKSWLVQDQTVPVQKQTAFGKDKSNPLIVDSLLKTIRLSIHLVVYNEELAIPEQTATGKGISNPLMADLEEELAPTGDQSGPSAPPAPKTAKQLAARRNQERVKSILLLAIPDEYLLKFHNVADAKSLWEAIKSRFGGNVESKKMQKNVLKHQFEIFFTASNESLDKAYDRFQKLISQLEIALIMRNKPDIDEIDIDDLYNNLRVYEDELKRSSGSNSASQNLAFLSSENTSSTNEVSTASGDFGISTAGGINQVSSTPCAQDVAYSFFAQPTTSPQLENEDFQQMDGDDLEELDLRWQVAMLTVRVKKKGHFARECRSGRNQGRRSYGDNGRSNAPTNESSSQALVAQDGLGSYDWSNDFEVEPNHDNEREKHNKAKLEIRGYEIALESLESRILGHVKNELAWGEKYKFQNYELKCREIKINNLNLELEKVVKERDELKDKIAKWEESTKYLDEILNSQMSTRDKTGLGYDTQLNELRSNHENDSENSLSIFDVRSSDEENTPENDRFSKNGNKIIESQTTELNIKTSETAGQTNDANTKKPKSASESVVSNPKIDRDRVIIEDWNSDGEEEMNVVQTVRPETQTVKTREDKSGQNSQKQGISFRKEKACFVCKSTEHLIKDCNFHDKKNQEPKLKNVVNTGQREGKSVWDNTKRVNHQKFSKYPHLSKTFVPSGVLTRTGLHRPSVSTARPICTARPSVSTARPVGTDRPSVSTAWHVCTARLSVSTARPVCTAKPNVSTSRPVYATRPIYLRMDNVRPRGSCLPIKRSYYIKPAFKPKDLKQDVKTFWVQNMTTARTRAVVKTGKGKLDTDLKNSRWVWRPKGNYLDHVSKDSGSFMLKKVEYVDPKGISKSDHAVVDSGCSSHMTGNKAYLSDYEDFNEGFVAFGNDPKGDELKFNLFSVSQMCDKKNSVLFTKSECLILSPSFKLLDESQVVLRAPRKDDVYNLDLKNIVHSGGHLVRGLPLKVFVNDHTCVACKKGKQHKASCKAKLERIIRKPLELLHMDLFGPVSIESINKKRYCLVVTDDFSRFSWVFFLATKDETSEILCNLIIGLENQLSHNVKIIRCDNGTEFKNHAMNEFCAKKGIKREFSVARTLQQNGVAERKNRTLIEAARTMLADSLLPIPFWAEAVNTACYVLNRVLVTKPQNKTPYELLIGKSPSISFMRPFGCPLTILNTLDSLGKFDGKSDEGYLLGYSTSSKAFRVYNKRTKRVEENLHINFLEDQPNVTDPGTQDSYVAGSSGKDKGPTQEYILLPLQPHRTRIPIEDVAPAAHEKPSKSSPKDNDIQDLEDVIDKKGQHQMPEDEQVLHDELEKMVTQELTAKAMDDVSRQAIEEEKRKIASQKKAAQVISTNKLSTDRSSVSTDRPFVSTANTSYVSAAITSKGANAGESSFVYLGGKIPIDASTLPNADLPIDPNMPNLEDAFDTLLNDLMMIKMRSYISSSNKSEDSKGFFSTSLDVKSVFLYGTIEKEVYVHQPPGFVDPAHPNKVYKMIKVLYGLHQAPRAWYETLSSFLMENGFRRGTIDKTLFIKKKKSDIMLVQVYVDDIIFGSTKKSMCTEFEDCMHKRFQMSSMGELTFFLGLQVKQQPDGIFISQDKYVADILKKFDFLSIRTTTTPIESNKPLVKDDDGADVDVHVYRSMIGSLIYLTTSRPDIVFAVCACARFQVTPKASHLNAVKRIFRYLKHQPKLGLWYSKDSPFELKAYSDSDYGGANLDRKSTTCGCQFLGRRLISWQCKKQTIMVNSTTKAEYVTVANYCGQHNMVAYLEKINGNKEFHQIMDFLTRNLIYYPLTVSPIVSTSFVEQFWTTAKSRTVNNNSYIDATVAGKPVTISEASIRSDLLFDDADGIDSLNNQAIFNNI